MNQIDRKEYLNKMVLGKNDYTSAPKTLYKYLKFDEFTYKSLNEKYIYLSPANKQDDETECIAKINIGDLIDLKTINLKSYCVDKIIDNLYPNIPKEKIDYLRYKFHRIMGPNGQLRNNFLLDLNAEIKEDFPSIDTVQLINFMADIPSRLDKEENKKAVEALLEIGLSARQTMGIGAMGEESNNDDLWKRYGGNFTGYCIEYDIENYSHKDCLFPVLYVDENNRETNIIIQIVNNFVNVMINKISAGKIKVDLFQFLSLFLTKYNKWSQQNEWRILGKTKDEFPAPTIKRIIIGRNASIEDKNTMIKYCSDHTIKYEIQK